MATTDFGFVHRLLEYWDACGIPRLSGVTRAELDLFECNNGVSLPNELREFYLATNGLRVPGSQGVDDRLFDFWPLRDLCRVAHAPSKFFFADVQQAAWEFAIEVEGDADPKGAVYILMAPPVKVAPSFASFIDLYMANDESLYAWSWYQPEADK
jgi:hypothetical protein